VQRKIAGLLAGLFMVGTTLTLPVSANERSAATQGCVILRHGESSFWDCEKEKGAEAVAIAAGGKTSMRGPVVFVVCPQVGKYSAYASPTQGGTNIPECQYP